MKIENLEKSPYKNLVEKAIEALDHAYTPYSHFQVGAGLLDKKGRIWTGCNIENAAYSPSNCAERTAIFKAVSEGEKDFAALAVAARKEGEKDLTKEVTAPCGVCRQVLQEFCPPEMPVILVNREGELFIYRLDELLPASFGKENLK